MHKTWNVRDETTDALKALLVRKLKEIDDDYKMLRKLSNIEDAKKLLDEMWQTRSFANDIDLELIRREFDYGTQNRSGSRRPETLYPDCKAGKEHQRAAEGIAGRYPAVSDTNQRKEKK